MAFVLTDPEAIRLANAIAEVTGQTIHEVVLEALREAYERLANRHAGDATDG